MDNTTIKLNARGTIIYVDYMILMKSNYFKNMLSGKLFEKSKSLEDGSYYVDCDSDVMIELIAYMETGLFKYTHINPKYMELMIHKYGIDFIKDSDLRIVNSNSCNDLLEKIMIYINNNIKDKVDNYIHITLKDTLCDTYEISCSISNPDANNYSTYYLYCNYNYKLFDLSQIALKNIERTILELIKKYKLDHKYTCRSVNIHNQGVNTISLSDCHYIILCPI